MLNKRWIKFFAVTALIFAGAGVPGTGLAGWGTKVSPLSDEEQAGLLYMREEEKLARDSYLVLADIWGLPVFSNIADSEQNHMDAVEKLLSKYELEDPVTSETDIGTFKDLNLQALFDRLMEDGAVSAMQGLWVGGEIEETDMRDIQAWIDLSDHEDIINTYETLMCGARNHLRAFVAQIELAGEVYEAQVITQAEVDAIVNVPTERQCGGNRRGGKRW